MKTAAFFTLGCKVNQYETRLMIQAFRNDGWTIADDRGEMPVFADAYILNTCTVTRAADKKSGQYIRRAKRTNPDAVVAVCGCYSQTNPAEVEAIPDVDIIIGTEDKLRILDIINDYVDNAQNKARTKQFLVKDTRVQEEKYKEHPPALTMESRTRAVIKIEDGCNRFCSYCVIPYARGQVRSRELSSIVDEARALIESGCKEIVLTGINTALYGSDWPDTDISGIDKVIERLNDIPGDFRIRLGSLEPTVVNAEYVKKLFAYDKLCHHLHLSVQSGSNSVISAMNRNYTREQYLSIVQTLRDFDPLYGITTDIITGFPGESESDFEDSISLARSAGFLKVHAFPYSKRLFTKAAQMPEQIHPDIKKNRNKRLIAEARAVSQAFRSEMKDSVQRVLVEEYTDGRYKGHASNFCEVYFESDDTGLENTFADVRISGLYADGVTGILQNGSN